MKRKHRLMVLPMALIVGLGSMVMSCTDPYLSDPADHRSQFGNDLETGVVVRYTELDNCTDYLLMYKDEPYVPSNLHPDFKKDGLLVLFSFEPTDRFSSCDPAGSVPVMKITHMEEIYR